MVDAGAKKWAELSTDVQNTVKDNLAKVFNSSDVAKKCSVKITGEFVNDLKAGTTENNVGVSVTGNVGNANADKIDDLTN